MSKHIGGTHSLWVIGILVVKGVETGSLTGLLLVLGVEGVDVFGEAEVLGGNLESVTSPLCRCAPVPL